MTLDLDALERLRDTAPVEWMDGTDAPPLPILLATWNALPDLLRIARAVQRMRDADTGGEVPDAALYQAMVEAVDALGDEPAGETT